MQWKSSKGKSGPEGEREASSVGNDQGKEDQEEETDHCQHYVLSSHLSKDWAVECDGTGSPFPQSLQIPGVHLCLLLNVIFPLPTYGTLGNSLNFSVQVSSSVKQGS